MNVADAAVVSKKHLREWWPDLVIGGALAVATGVASFCGAQRIPAKVVREPFYYDVWFSGDLPRTYANMTDRWGDPRHHTAVHLLFPLVVFPLAKALRVTTRLEPLAAVRAVFAFVAALWLGVLFGVLRSMGCRQLDAVLFSLLAIVSASAMCWFVVPETWSFGSLTILFTVWLAAQPKPFRTSAVYVLASAATLGITLTNWMAGIFMAFARFPWRRALRITVAAGGLVALLWGVERCLFSRTQLTIPSYQAKYFFQLESGGPRAIINSFVFHTMVIPSVTATHGPGHPGVLSLTTQHSSPGSGTVWGGVAVWLWAGLLGLGMWTAFFTRHRHRPLAIVLGAVLLGQLALHLVYGGEETFLYSLHWLPCLIVVAAFSTLTRIRRMVLALAGALLICAGINNGVQFTRATQFLVRDGMVGPAGPIDGGSHHRIEAAPP